MATWNDVVPDDRLMKQAIQSKSDKRSNDNCLLIDFDSWGAWKNCKILWTRSRNFHIEKLWNFYFRHCFFRKWSFNDRFDRSSLSHSLQSQIVQFWLKFLNLKKSWPDFQKLHFPRSTTKIVKIFGFLIEPRLFWTAFNVFSERLKFKKCRTEHSLQVGFWWNCRVDFFIKHLVFGTIVRKSDYQDELPRIC